MVRPASVALAAGLLVVASSTAQASEDCLDGWVAVEPAFADTIPADGVIALRAAGYGHDDSLEFTVYPNFSEPIAGALERSGGGMLVWRPAEPLIPGRGYTLHFRAENHYPDEDCGFPAEIELLETFTATESGRPEPRWELFEVRHGVEVHPSTEHGHIVCCKDAYAPFDISWGYSLGDRCAATRGEGRLHAAYSIDPEAWRLGLGQLNYRPFRDLAVVEEHVRPYDAELPLPCAEIAAIDLITGETLRGPPVCPDPGLEVDLGPYILDPRETLTCDKLHTCEEDDWGWDPDECRRWHGEGRGCGCAADEGAARRPSASSLCSWRSAAGDRPARPSGARRASSRPYSHRWAGPAGRW